MKNPTKESKRKKENRKNTSIVGSPGVEREHHAITNTMIDWTCPTPVERPHWANCCQIWWYLPRLISKYRISRLCNFNPGKHCITINFWFRQESICHRLRLFRQFVTYKAKS
uniref:Uncharacterized protein n=1 Tax=Romanomermis culicivorax TaxID=13658 RepID=A0A915ITU0_ROMCU